MAISAKLRARVVQAVREWTSEIQAEEGLEALDHKRFVEIEDQACAVGDSITAALIEAVAEQQSRRASQAPTARCPGCQREGKRTEPEPRVLATRRGEVAWQEPAYYCRNCRQAFFPQSRELGIEPEAEDTAREVAETTRPQRTPVLTRNVVAMRVPRTRRRRFAEDFHSWPVSGD